MNNKTFETMSRGDSVLAFALFLAVLSLVLLPAINPYAEHQDHTVQMRVVQPVRPAIAAELVRAVVEPHVAPEPHAGQEAKAAGASAAQNAEEKRCLAEAMYYEARGEGRTGEMAIAEVIFHRIQDRNYPRTVCGVVFEAAADRHACQFSFVCNGQMERPKSPVEWARAKSLAGKILAGDLRLKDMTGDAMFYHAASVDPDWAATLERTVQIGNHIFYRRPSRSSGI